MYQDIFYNNLVPVSENIETCLDCIKDTSYNIHASGSEERHPFRMYQDTFSNIHISMSEKNNPFRMYQDTRASQ